MKNKKVYIDAPNVKKKKSIQKDRSEVKPFIPVMEAH